MPEHCTDTQDVGYTAQRTLMTGICRAFVVLVSNALAGCGVERERERERESSRRVEGCNTKWRPCTEIPSQPEAISCGQAAGSIIGCSTGFMDMWQKEILCVTENVKYVAQKLEWKTTKTFYIWEPLVDEYLNVQTNTSFECFHWESTDTVHKCRSGVHLTDLIWLVVNHPENDWRNNNRTNGYGDMV